MTSFLDTVVTVFKKEMWEHFRTWRLIVIGGIFAFVFIVISLYGGILSGQGNAELSYKAGANSVLETVLLYTGFFPGLMAIVISYTSIVGERSRKSLILLVSKPVKRPALFAGKFLSSYFAIVLVYLVVMTVGYLGVVAASGKTPSADQVGRAYGAVGFVLLAMACWVAFAMFLSSVLKNPITVAVSAIMVWFLVLPIVSSIGMIYWMVTTGEADQSPGNVELKVLPDTGGNSTVILSSDRTFKYTVWNDTTELAGVPLNNSYNLFNVPAGNYSWKAGSDGLTRSGTLRIDSQQTVIITYKTVLQVTVPRGLNATLQRDGQRVLPANTLDMGLMRIETFPDDSGECLLRISENGQDLFTGNYTLKKATAGRMRAFDPSQMPDYARYNQLINPDNAMTGYQQLLDPEAKASVSPAEGAGALLAFFLMFAGLGLLAFSRMEMT